MDSELEILISAVDEASETIAEVGAAVGGMADDVSSATDAASSAYAEFGLQVNETTGEIQNALLTQEQSFALAADMAQQSSDEIIELMASEGISSQEAAATIAEANDLIASSSEGAAEAVTLSKGSFTAIGIAAGIGFTAIASVLTTAISNAEQWNETSAIIANNLKNMGSSIPVSAFQSYAEQIQNVTLFTQNDALQAEAQLSSYKALTPQYEQITMLAADLATKMQAAGLSGATMQNAMKLISDAMSDPVAGMTRLINQAGEALPAATVTMLENLAKAGDTAGASSEIYNELSQSIGGSATAAANAAGGPLVQLQNQLTALAEDVVNSGLLITLDQIAKDLIPIIQEISQWAEEHPKLTEAIVVGTAAFAAFLAVLTIVGIVIAATASAFAGAAVAIAAVSAAIAVVVIENWQDIWDKTQVVWNGIYEFFVGGWELEINLFKTSLDAVGNVWKSAWTDMSGFLTNIWNTIQNTVKTGVNYVIEAINAFINALDAINISIPSIAIPGTKLSTPAISLGFHIPDLPMLAEGGFVTQPTLALIGEAGPEAVVPLSGAGAGFGGQQIVVNVNGGVWLNQSTVKQLADMVAKSITTQVRVTNYRT